MKESDVIKLFFEITIRYPRERAFIVSDNTRGNAMTKAWYEELADLDYAVALMAVRAHANKSEWPPSIADLRKEAAAIMNPETSMTEDEAWGYVMTAIKKYGYYQADKARDSMPPEIWQIVERMGFYELCVMPMDQLSVRAGQFGRYWKAQSERKRKEAVLPASLKAQIASFGKMQELQLLRGGIENV